MTDRDRCRGRRAFPALLSCICLVLLLCSPPTGARTPGTGAASEIELPTVSIGGVPYLSLKTVREVLGGRLRPYPIKKKAELRLKGHTFVFTLLSSVIVADDVAYRMPLEVRLHDGGFHVPADAFVDHLGRAIPLRLRLRAPSMHAEAVAETAGEAPETVWGQAAPPPEAIRQPEVDAARWNFDTVIIDPGHGGKDPGAVGPRGTREKDIVLRVAKRLKVLLEKQDRVRVVLTRSDDTFIPLWKRSKIAIENQGKLFISLHCNASRKRRSGGIEVYFLSDAKTAEAAEVARRENAVLRYEENTDLSNGPGSVLDGIISGMLSTRFLKESQDLAAYIRAELAQTAADLDDRGVKQANFYVMRGTMGSMPSVLVEMGFISNRTEEKRLRSAAFRKKLAEAVHRGIQTFKRRYAQGISTAK